MSKDQSQELLSEWHKHYKRYKIMARLFLESDNGSENEVDTHQRKDRERMVLEHSKRAIASGLKLFRVVGADEGRRLIAEILAKEDANEEHKRNNEGNLA